MTTDVHLHLLKQIHSESYASEKKHAKLISDDPKPVKKVSPQVATVPMKSLTHSSSQIVKKLLLQPVESLSDYFRIRQVLSCEPKESQSLTLVDAVLAGNYLLVATLD